MQSSYQPWTTLQPVACLPAPCNFRHPVRACPLLVPALRLLHWEPSLNADGLAVLEVAGRSHLQCAVILNAVMSWLQILAGAPPTSPLPTRAVFQYAPSRDSAVGQDICLQAGVLELSTVSVYINGTFTW